MAIKDTDKQPTDPALIAAEVKHFEALAIQAKGEAAKSKAEALKLAAETKEVDLRLIKARYDVEREEEKRKKELASDEHHHTYYFKGGVDLSSVDKCLDQLRIWNHTDDEPGELTIKFFSPGGSVMPGMALFDEISAMRQDGWHVTTMCRGYAASMGGILLQVGDIRTCGPESYILIHEISSGAVGKIGELEDEIDFVKMIQERVNDLFVTRSGGKVTAAKLRAMYRRKDFWLDSKKALSLGIVDEIR